MDTIKKIKKEIEPILLRLPGVTGVGVGYKKIDGKKTDTLAILVYVKKKRKVDEKEAIQKQIKGVPTDIIEQTFVLHK